MRRFPSCFLLSCTALAWAPWASAQATLSGSVSTSDGLGVPQIALTLEGGAGPQRTVTGPLGRYRFNSLAAGEYRVSVDAPGFALTGDGKLALQADTVLDLVLRPQPVREQVVVTATRGDAAVSGVGVTVTVLDTGRLTERDAPAFIDLLREVPGVAVARAGGVGLQTSAFVRGGESNFALVLIDGVPVNEPGGAYNYAAQFPLELGQVEVVRGAASSLYGNDALAGAVHLVTRRAALGEKPGVSLDAEGGEFDWRRARAATSGRASRFDWNGGVARLETDN
jgi:outer membrane cobalamin receptor